MATTRNIQMQYYNGTDYDVLYPMANYQNMVGTPPGISGDLSFSDISGTVSTSQLPTVPINKGGTGATSAASARSNLGITPGNIGAAASSHNHNASNITSGTLPLTRGGTGATSASGAVGSLTYGATVAGSLSNSYYFPCASSSSAGRRVGLDTLGNYIMNNFGGSSGGLSYKTGSYIGTGFTSNTINIGSDYILFYLSKISRSNFAEMRPLGVGVTDFDRQTDVVFNDWIFLFKIPGVDGVGVNLSDGVNYRKNVDLTFSGNSIVFENLTYVEDIDNEARSENIDDRASVMLNAIDDTYKWIAITIE